MNAEDMSAVEACIQNYFEALYTGDTDLLMGSVFHPNAHLYAANMGGGMGTAAGSGALGSTSYRPMLSSNMLRST